MSRWSRRIHTGRLADHVGVPIHTCAVAREIVRRHGMRNKQERRGRKAGVRRRPPHRGAGTRVSFKLRRDMSGSMTNC
jgi:hypothetical protein